MPFVDQHAPLPQPMRRVLVAGTSGSGKTTFACAFAARTGVPHTEIDALFHGAGWQPRPSFLADVGELAAQPSWVTEWQYGAARPILVAVADTLVWIDLPIRVVMWRVVQRTLRRRLRLTELWNGNVEPPLHTFFTDDEHIVRWAWRTRRKLRDRVPAVARAHPELAIVRLRTAREVRGWLDRLGPAPEVQVSRPAGS